MFIAESNIRIWFYKPPTDMRKSFNGLSALVKTQLQDNPLNGAYFVFVNRKRTLMKVLFFDRNGFCIWFKKLEQGAFQLPKTDQDQQKIELDYTQLKLILEGIDLDKIHRRKRYKNSKKTTF